MGGCCHARCCLSPLGATSACGQLEPAIATSQPAAPNELLLHHDRSVYWPHHCRRGTDPLVDLAFYRSLTGEQDPKILNSSWWGRRCTPENRTPGSVFVSSQQEAANLQSQTHSCIWNPGNSHYRVVTNLQAPRSLQPSLPSTSCRHTSPNLALPPFFCRVIAQQECLKEEIITLKSRT